MLFSSSYATYIRKIKGRESDDVVALRLKLHQGDSFMGCTFTKIRLLRGIISRTFISRTLEFRMYYAIVLYTWPSQYGPYNHNAMSGKNII